MAQPYSNDNQSASNISIISPMFCHHSPLHLAIARKAMILARGNFEIRDTDGNLMFMVKQPWSFCCDKIIMYDAAGIPVVTLRKAWSFHSRWQVFRGDGSEPGILVFSVKRSSFWQFNTKLNVFLAGNGGETKADFKVIGGQCEKSCVVYAGDSDTVLAQMHKKENLKSIFLGKDKFMVTVNPDVDHVFIAVLIVILDAINRAAQAARSGGHG